MIGFSNYLSSQSVMAIGDGDKDRGSLRMFEAWRSAES